MRREVRRIATILMGLAAPAAAAQDQVTVTGARIQTCANTPALADYGPVRRMDGIYSSYVDAARFVPCARGAACRRRPGGPMLDVRFAPGAHGPRTQGAYDGWGDYRIVFVGRRGRWRSPHPCLGEPSEFVEVRRVLRFERLN